MACLVAWHGMACHHVMVLSAHHHSYSYSSSYVVSPWNCAQDEWRTDAYLHKLKQQKQSHHDELMENEIRPIAAH